MIKVCDNHHVTGFRTCWCGASTTPQNTPFTEFPEVRAAREARESARPKTPTQRIGLIQHVRRIFRYRRKKKIADEPARRASA